MKNERDGLVYRGVVVPKYCRLCCQLLLVKHGKQLYNYGLAATGINTTVVHYDCALPDTPEPDSEGVQKFPYELTVQGSLTAGEIALRENLKKDQVLPDEVVRKFDTGATRDVDHNKLDYEAFLSPVVLRRYAQFLHSNRVQKDGSIRAGDNWQKGMPKDVYMKSMTRHFMDVWLHHRKHSGMAEEDFETALCALLFNVMGYLFEELKEKDDGND